MRWPVNLYFVYDVQMGKQLILLERKGLPEDLAENGKKFIELTHLREKNKYIDGMTSTLFRTFHVSCY